MKYIRTIDGIYCIDSLKMTKNSNKLKVYYDEEGNLLIPIKPPSSKIEFLCDYIMYKNSLDLLKVYPLNNLRESGYEIASEIAKEGGYDISFCILTKKGLIIVSLFQDGEELKLI